MPRPAATGRKNQHNARHENGLVGPGKRVSKQKSNGHLNGSPHRPASAVSTPSPPVLPPANESSSDTNNEPQIAINNSTWSDSKMDLEGATHANGSTRRDRAESYDNAADFPNSAALSPTLERAVGGTKMVKKASSGSMNPLTLAATILKSCPIYDTIAILIFLLQLPPTVLTLIQFLFASMTFMPPTGNQSPSSLSLHFDIFQGPAGTPSLGTMIAMDGFCLFVWGIFLWPWAQNFALDLAQVQVAITLGGGSAGRSGGVNILCVFIVLILHLAQSKGVQQFVLNYLFSAKIFSSEVLSQYSQMLSSEVVQQSKTSPSWIRSLLAVHILAQAATAIARRSMANNRTTSNSKTGKRVDPEASAGSTDRPDSATFESSTASVSSVTGIDGPMLPSTIRDGGRDRVTSAKKRRRQANQIRSRQPFWAALASTKVALLREYEANRATARGNALQALGDSGDDKRKGLEDGILWITEVGFSSIKFEASDFGVGSDVSGTINYDNLRQNSLWVAPFRIFLNGAQWTSVTLTKVAEEGSDTIRWRGEISGLAPNFSYTCAFVRSDNQQEICVVNLKTPQTPAAEQGLSGRLHTKASEPNLLAVNPTLASPPPRAPLRPSSPSTTVKNSISAAESKLSDLRGRLKKSKNDHRLHLSKLKKEVENYNNRLVSGGDENRLNQRSLQLERNIKSTEEAIVVMEKQLDELENVPEKEMDDWNSAKAAYEKQKQHADAAKADLATTQQAIARDVHSHQSELSSLVQRHERLKARQARQKEDHESLTNANAQGLSEKERKATERANRAQDRAKVENGFYDQFQSINRSISDFQSRAKQTWAQVSALENAQQRQQEQLYMQHGPLTPEGIIPGTGPAPISRPSGFAFGSFGVFGPPPSSSSPSNTTISTTVNLTPMHSNSPDPFGSSINAQHRQRSNSVHSVYSDFSDPAFIPAYPSDHQAATHPVEGVAAKMERMGSGHGTGNGVGVIGRQSASSPFAIHSHSPVSAHAVWN